MSGVLAEAAFDPKDLERTEERLFALRAAARKFNVPVDDLAALGKNMPLISRRSMPARADLRALEAAAKEADTGYVAAARALGDKRRKAAAALDKAVKAELPPLKLERARFITEISADETVRGPDGFERVDFQVETNPGTKPGPLMKVASGGELARFILALKVVLADKGSAPTLVFDEIDTARRRRRRGRHRPAAGAACQWRAGDGGDARAAGGGAGGQPLSHQQGTSEEIPPRCHARCGAAVRHAPGGDRPHAGRRHHHGRGAGSRREAARRAGEAGP